MTTGSAPTVEQFVGRSHELRQLAAACEAAAAGRGRVVVVSGDAGVGKTRICDEVSDQATRLGLRVVAGRCWVDGVAPAFWPWPLILGQLGSEDPLGQRWLGGGRPVVDGDRFAVFAAVANQIAAACSRSPLCLIIEDAHAADPGTLLLIRFVARSLPQLPLVLVLTRRSGAPVSDAAPSELLDEIESEATPIVLAPFDSEETSTFLTANGFIDIDSEMTLALHRVTGGNPLFLRRVAALGTPNADDPLPAGLRVAIEQALTRLSSGAQRILRASAVLGTAPSVNAAAEVAGADPVTVLDAVGEAVAAGLVVVRSTDRFSFSHELIRSVLEETSDNAERLEAHARAAAAIDGDGPASPERLARQAHHALAAAPRSVDDARLAVSACEVAAGSMVDSFAYEQADALLSAAVRLHEWSALGPPSGHLLVRWAQAAMQCGQMNEARHRFDRAVTVTQRQGDPVLLAEAALGLGGHGVREHRSTLERTRVLGLQRSALAGLPEGHTALQCRLQSRLAAEEVIDGGPIEQAFAALEAARACGDALALAEALALTHHVSLMPEHDQTRLVLAEELIQVAVEAGDGVLGLTGLWFRTIDLFHLGDSRAFPSLEELRRRARALRSQNILAGIEVIDVMLLIRAGRLAQAEVAAHRVCEQAVAVGEINALTYLAAQQLAICWLQGRDAELVDVADKVADSPDVGDAVFAFRATAAALTARAGQTERARAMLDDLAPDGLAALPQSSTWLIGMAAVVDLAVTLEDADLARGAYGLLLIYAGVPCLGGFAVLCLGSTEHALGIAASTWGDYDRAVGHLERAVAENRRLAHRPMVAIAQADLANTLVRRGRSADHEVAVDLLTRAVTAADDMAMDVRAVTWRDRLRDLTVSRRALANGQIEPRRGTIRRHGSRWEIALDGHRVRVGDLIGMGYLSELLTRPGQLIASLSLASRYSMPRFPTRHELLDDEARAAYTARALELTAELGEAEAHNDLGRAERLRVELDMLVDELEGATGLQGRPRTFTDPGERARSAVRKAIKRALDAIDDASPVIADDIRNTVTTGTTCTYTPDPRAPVTWSTEETTDAPEADPVLVGRVTTIAPRLQHRPERLRRTRRRSPSSGQP